MAKIIEVSKTYNNAEYVGKLHSFSLYEGQTEKGKYVRGRLNLATDEHSVFQLEVFASALTKAGAPNPTYVLLIDILKGAQTIVDRSEEDAKLAGMIQDKALAQQITSGLALSKRPYGYENALKIRAIGGFEMNVYEDQRTGEEVVGIKRRVGMIAVSNNTPSANFKVHARIGSVTETSVPDVYIIKAFAMNWNQTSLIPLTLKTDVPGAGAALDGMIGEMLVLEGQDRSLVIEKEVASGVFGTRMKKEYDKGLYVTSAENVPVDIDEEAFLKAKQNYELLKSQTIANAKERQAKKEISTPVAPKAEAAVPGDYLF